MPHKQSQILATINTSPARRAFGIGVVGGLAALLFYMALSQNFAEFGYKVVLLLFAVAAALLAARMLVATREAIHLTPEAVVTASGTEIARLDQIVKLDRGAFAFKPSNGFILLLNTPLPRVWAPGLWWRMGKRVGVGGVTAAHETKAFAEMLTGLLMEARPQDFK